jgi:hypothetical protein
MTYNGKIPSPEKQHRRNHRRATEYAWFADDIEAMRSRTVNAMKGNIGQFQNEHGSKR